MNEICGDNRFEIIAKAKSDFLEATNIALSKDAMKVLDNFLFRCWQMGWLDRYADQTEPQTDCNECKYAWWNSDMKRYECSISRCPYNEQTEPSNSEKPNNCEVKNYCDDCLYRDTCDSKEFFYACTSKATISKMEQVDKDINVRSKDEEYINNLPWTEVGNGEQTDDAYFLELMGAVERGEISDAGANQAWYEYINHKDEPQTDCAWK